jgi:aspartate kinase
MSGKVVKFGGSSLADAEHFQQVKEILLSDSSRRYVVPSAPGKRFKEDNKVTDMLYQCYLLLGNRQAYEELFEKIGDRYREIASELGLDLDLEPVLTETCREIRRRKSRDFAASRGEYLNGVLLANYLGWDFIDPTDVIKFDRRGEFAAEWTNELMRHELQLHENAVIPGFFGSYPNGEVHTFSRGGSDITGAIVARAANAEVYENWTDVNGFLVADPRVVDTPHRIKELTYRELRELSYMGASVLHADAIFPVKKVGIPINIRNTFDPERSGTMIVANREHSPRGRVVTGIAGKKHFSVIHITKSMMNTQVGFMRRILSVLEYHDLSCDHMPSGIDTLSVVIDAGGKTKEELDQVVNEISAVVQPDEISVLDGISLVATVGHGMLHKVGTAARIFTALARHNVNIRMIDQGASELSIIVGVVDEDYETCVQALYEEFFM